MFLPHSSDTKRPVPDIMDIIRSRSDNGGNRGKTMDNNQSQWGKSPQRICNMWSIIEGHMIKDRIHVKRVGENLGY
jgi:hypothetical protein